MARDDIATAKREKRDGFGVNVIREVPLEQLEHVAVAKLSDLLWPLVERISFSDCVYTMSAGWGVFSH